MTTTVVTTIMPILRSYVHICDITWSYDCDWL